MEPHHDPQGSPRGPSICPKVKEKVQTLISQLSVLPGETFSHKLGFVKLVEGDLGDNFLHESPPSRLGSKLSKKPSYASLGVHLPTQKVQKLQAYPSRAESSEGQIEGPVG